MADGYAVKELFKVTSLLYDAMKTKSFDPESAEGNVSTTGDALPYDVASKVIQQSSDKPLKLPVELVYYI